MDMSGTRGEGSESYGEGRRNRGGARTAGRLLVMACLLAGTVAWGAPPPAPAPPGARTGASEPYSRAVALMRSGDFSAAIPLLEATLRVGDFKNAVWNLAVCYRSMGRMS